MNIESIVAPVRERIEEIDQELMRLRQEFIDKEQPLREELRAAKRIMNAVNPPGKTGRPKGIVAGNRSKGSVPAARYGVVTNAVLLQLMQRKGEFRGIDVRTELPEAVNGVKVTSSNVAEAFNALREDGYIRFVRKEGNSRYYAKTGDDPSPELLERLGVK